MGEAPPHLHTHFYRTAYASAGDCVSKCCPKDVGTEPQYLAAVPILPDDRCRLGSGNKILRLGQGTRHLGSCPEAKAKDWARPACTHSPLNVKHGCGKGLGHGQPAWLGGGEGR